MKDDRTLKEQLDESAARADGCLALLKAEGLSREEFRKGVRDFTLAKFFLKPEECDSEVIFVMAEKSIQKLLRMNDKSVKLAVGSTTCTNQSSTDIKKVLLSLTLQRNLDVQLTPDASAELETVTQLADALYDELHAKRAPR